MDLATTKPSAVILREPISLKKIESKLALLALLLNNSLKQDPERYRLYLEKDKRKRKERKIEVLSPSELAKKRRECRKRVRLHRLKKKKSHSILNTLSGSSDEGKVYKTPQTLGKAVRKVKQAMPHSPRKRRAVISKLAKSADGISPSGTNAHKTGNKQLPGSNV